MFLLNFDMTVFNFRDLNINGRWRYSMRLLQLSDERPKPQNNCFTGKVEIALVFSKL